MTNKLLNTVASADSRLRMPGHQRLCCVVITLLLLNYGLPLSGAAETKPVVREIFVPYENLDVIVEAQPQRVFLSREDYLDLLKRSRRAPQELAPQGALLVAADYEAAVANGRALITGSLTFDVIRAGLQTLRLDLRDVGVKHALLDGQPAPLHQQDDGSVELFLEGLGRHQMKVELVAKLETTAAQQTLQFQIPEPPATRFRLRVEGNVELRHGASVLARQVVDSGRETLFELLPERGPATLVLSVNNRFQRAKNVVTVRSVLIDEVTQAYERLHGTYSVDVIQGSVDRVRFAVPLDFDIVGVVSPGLLKWAVEAEESRQVLEVLFCEPTSKPFLLGITATRDRQLRMDWRVPRIDPLDFHSNISVLGLLLEDRLQLESMQAAGLIPVDIGVLRRAMPASLLSAQAGGPDVRAVAAHFAPHSGYDLQARFKHPAAHAEVELRTLLSIENTRLELRTGINFTAKVEKLFDADIILDSEWTVASVSTADGQPVAFEQFAATPDSPARIHVSCEKGIAVGQTLGVYLDAHYSPPAWLDEWNQRTVTIPRIAIPAAAMERGEIVVRTNVDFQARIAESQGLLLPRQDPHLEEEGESEATWLAYRYDTAGYSATLSVTRKLPQITARVANFLRLSTDGLVAHYELNFDIDHAHAQQLMFDLPATTPADVSIRGLQGVTIKQHQSELINDQRRWRVHLATPHRGRVMLAVDLQQRVGEVLEDFALPLARAAGVQYQSAVVAVEGRPDFDTDVRANGRNVDVGELAECDYRVGRHLLGVFGFSDGEAEVRIDTSSRQGYGVPAAIVERSELATVVSKTGVAQTAARYSLRTKASFLQVRLPADAELWSTTIDRAPIAPQNDGTQILVHLPVRRNGDTLDLRIVYQTAHRPGAFITEIDTAAPILAVRNESSDGAYPVPIADVIWHLLLPEGQRVARSHGTVFRIDDPAERMAWTVGAKSEPTSAPTGLTQFSEVARDLQSDAEVPNSPLPASEAASRAASSEAEAVEAQQIDKAFELRDEMSQQQAGVDMPTHAASPAVPGKSVYWALDGVRSLPIEINRSVQAIKFQSLGVNPRLQASLLDQPRLDYVLWTLTLIVGLIGLLTVQWPVVKKAKVVVAAMVVCLAVPLAGAALTDLDLHAVFQRPFLASCLLAPFYFALGLLGVMRNAMRRIATRSVPATTAVILLGLVTSRTTFAQQPNLPIVDLIGALAPSPVELPADAVIIPYDAEASNGIERADKVLVPYDKYMELWTAAYPDDAAAAEDPAVPFATSSVAYRTLLRDRDELVVEGSLFLQLFVDESVEIALPLQGGVLTHATLDGRPARIRVVSPESVAPGAILGRRALRSLDTPPLLVVHAEGKGRKRLEFSLTMPLQRRGGWRITSGLLPNAAAAQLTVEVPQAGTELVIRGATARGTFESTQDGEKFETALARNGRLELQWRPIVAAGEVDQSLSISSTNVLDVQEDALRLTCRAVLEMRRSDMESFIFRAPSDYLVEQVQGENIRGWRTLEDGDQGDSSFQRIEVNLLRPAQNSESLTIRLSQPFVLDETASFTAPYVSFPAAVLHRGYLLVRRSPLVDLHASAVTALRRAETDDAVVLKLLPAVGSDSLLGLQPHQAFRFAAEKFALQLSASPRQSATHVVAQSILKLADNEAAYEVNLNFEVRNRPIFRTEVILPAGLQQLRVTAPGDYEWSEVEQANGNLLTIFHKSGLQGKFSVLLQGELPRDPNSATTPAPRIEVVGVDRQEGFVVVQVDPAVSVQPESLSGCQAVSLSRVRSWLNEQQCKLSKLVLKYDTPSYTALLRTTPREPKVSHFSITNVRVTDRDVETTLFVQFSILEAGIREVSLLVPTWMRDCKVTAPRVRQVDFESLETDPDLLRIKIEFAQELKGDLAVVVERDRPLLDGPIVTRLPVVETGRTNERFVVLENAGGDEIMLQEANGIGELDRQQPEFRKLRTVLGAAITQAFIVQDGAAAEDFSVSTIQREAIATADARIRLAEALLVVDAHGTYQGSQTYRMDNKTEQYLEILLPEGAALWTAAVAGQLIKPAMPAAGGNPQQIRIPLIKAAEGDLDYQVQLKYGGHTAPIEDVRRFDFPLIHTVNINVEESQVRLRVPESHRWFDFGGSMRRVTTRGDLAAGFLSYQTRQIESLQRILSSSEQDDFARVRAASNLKKAVSAANSYQQQALNEYSNANARLYKEAMTNSAVVREAQQQIEGSQSELSAEVSTYNRAKLRQLGQRQTASRSKGVVIQLGDNFAFQPEANKDAADDNLHLERKWFGGQSPTDRPRRSKAAAVKSGRKRAGEDGKNQLASPWSGTENLREMKKEDIVEQAQEKVDNLERKLYRYQQRLDANMDGVNETEEPRSLDFRSVRGGQVAGQGAFDSALAAPLEADQSTGFATADGEQGGGEALGLASLDVQLAERGHEFLFTTPRGDVSISARAIHATNLDRLHQLLIILAIAAAGFLTWRALAGIQRRLAT